MKFLKFFFFSFFLCVSSVASNDINLSNENNRFEGLDKTKNSFKIINQINQINTSKIKTEYGDFVKLTVPYYSTNSEIGTPELPSLMKLISVPNGSEVDVNIINKASKKIKLSEVFYSLLVISIMIAIADQTANLFKDSFQRLRPCYNESLISFVRLVNESCGGKYGFFSAHASNSFSLAVFFGLLFKNKFRFIIYMTLFYASLISFSRIYLGVHFPLDIFFGGVYGIITGLVIFRIYENRLNFFKFLNKS